jgi:hypothetical protein
VTISLNEVISPSPLNDERKGATQTASFLGTWLAKKERPIKTLFSIS